LSNQARFLLNSCLDIVHRLPSQPCLLCGTRVRRQALCPGCHDDLPYLPAGRCPQCALPVPGGGLCGGCLKHPPAFQHTVAVYTYAFPLDALVRHCKYQGALEVTDLFAQALAQQIQGHALPELLVPMPLHPARLAGRGFNQAGEIARRLARRLDLPWLAEACQRVRDTPPQAGLDLGARQKNLRGAFDCSNAIKGKRVALVDDVMTSGASLDALARAALKAGAAEVSAWVVARTL